MNAQYDSRVPTVDHLRERARRRIPLFAFEYLFGGCNEDINLRRNTSDLREIDLTPSRAFTDRVSTW
jgi:L-lactate dehydrogenase (cytochrome)